MCHYRSIFINWNFLTLFSNGFSLRINSNQYSRTILSILVGFNNSIIRIKSVLPWISNSLRLLTRVIETVLVTAIYHYNYYYYYYYYYYCRHFHVHSERWLLLEVKWQHYLLFRYHHHQSYNYFCDCSIVIITSTITISNC